MFLTSHSGECDVAGLCFGGVVGVVVAAVLVGVLVPPTMESMEKPILGLEGTATIGVGARGIIICLCVLLCFCPSSFVNVAE